MKTISIPQLRDLLLYGVHSPRPVGFVAVTKVAARRTGLPWMDIYKVVTINGMTGVDYQKSVNLQRSREHHIPDYRAAPRTWGKRISAALVEYRKSFYLATQITPGFTPRPIYLVPVPQPSGRVRLKPVPKEMVAPWLPIERVAEVAAAQGVIRGVCYRNFALTSLVSISLNGVRYRVRPA